MRRQSRKCLTLLRKNMSAYFIEFLFPSETLSKCMLHQLINFLLFARSFVQSLFTKKNGDRSQIKVLTLYFNIVLFVFIELHV